MKTLSILFLCIVFCVGCDDGDDGHKTDCDPADRIGAMCKDGSQSTATGSGTCAGHDGVDHWICK